MTMKEVIYMKEKTYHEDINIKNELHLRDLIKKLPRFCKEFFIGIENKTASRTRIAMIWVAFLIIFTKTIQFVKNSQSQKFQFRFWIV